MPPQFPGQHLHWATLESWQKWDSNQGRPDYSFLLSAQDSTVGVAVTIFINDTTYDTLDDVSYLISYMVYM